VFDASAMGTETGMEALAQCGDSAAISKYFATTLDWYVDPIHIGAQQINKR
jgi:hypothetical protein